MLLAKGKSELGYCECNICNQGYREIVAASKNAPGKRRLTANSREVVKEARGADITKFKLNVHDVLARSEKRDDNTEKVEPRDCDEKDNRRKITIDVDETFLEKIILKVLSTDKGRKVLKDALAK